MMSVNIEEEHVREDAGMGSLADVSCRGCELGSMGEGLWWLTSEVAAHRSSHPQSQLGRGVRV